MIIDTSVFIALLLQEKDSARLKTALLNDSIRMMSAASYVETGIVIEAKVGEFGSHKLDALLYAMEVQIIPVDKEQADLARRAYRIFGKGRHAASLNFGDCFSYALAKQKNEPLLFIGEDFPKTDIACVL